MTHNKDLIWNNNKHEEKLLQETFTTNEKAIKRTCDNIFPIPFDFVSFKCSTYPMN